MLAKAASRSPAGDDLVNQHERIAMAVDQGRWNEASKVAALAAGTGGDADRLTAAMVYEAAQNGDAFARALWDDAVRYLVAALANYVTLVNPRVLVLGGGVVESVPAMFDAVAADVPAQITSVARAVLRVERARLGDWSGVVGAAALAARG